MSRDSYFSLMMGLEATQIATHLLESSKREISPKEKLSTS